MKRKQKAVPPLMGEEIEWRVLIRHPDGKRRVPCIHELQTMINTYRGHIGYPVITAEAWTGAIEDTGGLRSEEDWLRFIRQQELFTAGAGYELGLLPSRFRFYIDHKLIETATPRCTNGRYLVIASKASEAILNIACRELEKTLPSGYRVEVFKDTSNRRDRITCAGHGNFLVNRETFEQLTGRLTNKTMQLASFLALSVPLTGAGMTGSANGAAYAPYQISQRADWIERILGLSTTDRRPLVNIRDQAHAAYVETGGAKVPVARLHNIFFEPNMCPESILMSYGYTSIFLLGLQDGIFDSVEDDIILPHTVRDIKNISRDIRMEKVYQTASGKSAKFHEILGIINARLREYFESMREPTGEQLEVLTKAEYYCDCFTGDPRDYFLELYMELDWVTRLNACISALPEGERWSCASQDTLDEILYNDLQYANIDPDKSWYYRQRKIALAEGAVEDDITSDEIIGYLNGPPEDSSDYLGGKLSELFPGRFSDWGAVLLPGKRVLHLDDPFRGTKREVGYLFESGIDTDALIEELKKMGFRVEAPEADHGTPDT